MGKRGLLKFILIFCIVAIVITVVPLTAACSPKQISPSTTAQPTTPAVTTSAPPATTAPAATTSKPATSTAPAKVYTLKALKGFVDGSNDNMGFLEYIKRVNEKAKGQLVIQDIGGPEVYPTNEQFAPLKLGTIDMLLTSSGYIANDLPEATALLYGFGASHSQLRSSGLFGKIDEWARAAHGVTFIGVPFESKFQLWLTKSVKTLDDLKAIKVRSHASYNPLLQPLGIPTVSVSIPELYSALDRGVIDAAVLGNTNLTIYGIEKIIRYRLDPPFWNGLHVPVFVNLKTFNGLPKDLQKILTDTMIEVENDLAKIYGPISTAANADLKAAGIQPVRLSDADWYKAEAVAWEKGLPDALKKVSPDHFSAILDLLKPLYPPKSPMSTVD